MRERQRQTATKPRYYIRGIEITAISGLGRFGVSGWPRPRLRAPSCVGPRVVPDARYPRTTLRHFDGLSPVLARRFRADLHEVGRKRWSCQHGAPSKLVRGGTLPPLAPKLRSIATAVRRTRPPGPGPRSRPDTLSVVRRGPGRPACLHLGLGRAAARYPRTTPAIGDGLTGRPRASVSRRSPRSRAHRGHRAGVEVGSGRPGPAHARSAKFLCVIGS